MMAQKTHVGSSFSAIVVIEKQGGCVRREGEGGVAGREGARARLLFWIA